ncbi:hypothetical protein NKH77_42500 [Streptomyces sp. M19]
MSLTGGASSPLASKPNRTTTIASETAGEEGEDWTMPSAPLPVTTFQRTR